MGMTCESSAGFHRISPAPGFGDAKNKYSWSMAKLDEKLYVGTLNAGVTLDTVLNNLPDLAAGPLDFFEQYEDVVESDGAEIWCYDLILGGWTKSLDMESIDPRTLGFRKMAVFGGAIFAGTLNAAAPAQIWSSTDGQVWSVSLQLTGANRSVRGMAVVGDRLYMGTENRDERAELWAFDGDAWELAMTFEGLRSLATLEELDGLLYLGTWDRNGGFEVYRFDGMTAARVVAKAQHDPEDLGVLSMHPFFGRMFIGTMNFARGFALYAYNPFDGSLEKIGQSGFGVITNAYAWRLEEHRGRLYLGTYTVLPGTRFQLWSSPDGLTWNADAPVGFGDIGNYGARTLLSCGHRLFLGTANNAATGSGTEVWMREDLE
jgi:hypothetical protein